MIASPDKIPQPPGTAEHLFSTLGVEIVLHVFACLFHTPTHRIIADITMSRLNIHKITVIGNITPSIYNKLLITSIRHIE
jgi:hypothetical protein